MRFKLRKFRNIQNRREMNTIPAIHSIPRFYRDEEKEAEEKKKKE